MSSIRWPLAGVPVSLSYLLLSVSTRTCHVQAVEGGVCRHRCDKNREGKSSVTHRCLVNVCYDNSTNCLLAAPYFCKYCKYSVTLYSPTKKVPHYVWSWLIGVIVLPPQCGVTIPNLSSVFVTAISRSGAGVGGCYISLFLAVTRAFMTPTHLERGNGMGEGGYVSWYLDPEV